LLELEVRVLNINEGRNKDIVSRCRKLREYSVFIAKIHYYWIELGNLEEAIKKAIKYCYSHDILREYLEVHGSEVLNMILTEWNTDDAIAFAREEGREEGLEKGREEGLERGREEGLEKGREEGLEIGREEKRTIARNLLAKGSIPEFVQEVTGLSLDEIKKL